MASRRISERCGCGALGDVETFELAINEPGMTEVTLGLKTWGSSYVRAHYLGKLFATSMFNLLDESLGQPASSVLELGPGTGLLGLAAASTWEGHMFPQ